MRELLTNAKWKKFLLLALSGALTGLTLVFPQVGFLEWITLVPLGLFLLSAADGEQYRYRTMYGYGFFYFMCFGVVVFHWFINLYPLDFIDGMTPAAAVAVVLAGSVGLSALQALVGGLAFMALRLAFRTTLLTKHTSLRPLAVAVIYTVYEWTQTLGWWGVPWGRLPIGQSKYIVGLQTSSLFGPFFITFLIVLVNMYVAYAVIERRALRLCGTVVLSALVFNYGVGTALYLMPTQGDKTVKIAAVQGNISSSDKWDSSTRERTLEVYREYTLRAASEGADIVVWPETALPYLVTEGNIHGYFCSNVAKEANVTLLVGGFSEGENGQYNSLICVLPDGSFHQTTYSKQHLVPFGEYVPMRGLFEILIPPLAELEMSGEDILAGEGSQVIEIDGVSVGGLICFDSIYDELARGSALDGAEIICLSTNDSWFTDSAALYMHNAQAQMRAIENGRWIVRAANTGISTVISSRGEVLCGLEPLVDGMVIYDVPVNTHTTLYTVTGNLVVYLGILALVLLAVYEINVKIRKKY